MICTGGVVSARLTADHPACQSLADGRSKRLKAEPLVRVSVIAPYEARPRSTVYCSTKSLSMAVREAASSAFPTCFHTVADCHHADPGQASNRTTQIQNGQNSDLYILSIPSFTWTYVGGDLPSQPTGRAAHTCTLMGSQMVVVGGFVSEDLM